MHTIRLHRPREAGIIRNQRCDSRALRRLDNRSGGGGREWCCCGNDEAACDVGNVGSRGQACNRGRSRLDHKVDAAVRLNVSHRSPLGRSEAFVSEPIKPHLGGKETVCP